MDLLTQGVLGAVAAAAVVKAVNRQKETRRAAHLGFWAGLLPDADVFIRSDKDPLLAIEFHRHFTHSLVFIPIGALFVAALAMLFTKVFFKKTEPLPWGRAYLYSLVGIATHAVLDSCTSYGTRILWPFSDTRISWDNVSIIDPLYTLPLLFVLVFALVKKQPAWCRAVFFYGVVYLLGGVYLRNRAIAQVARVAESRGHATERLEVKPSFGNLVLWRGLYRHNGQYYSNAVRLGFFGQESRIYEGESIEAIDLEKEFATLDKNTVLYKDLKRFELFSQGWLGRHPGDEGVISDVRYSALPQEMKPLWGIRVDPSKPDEHVQRVSFTRIDRRPILKLWSMIRGTTPSN